MKSPFHGSKKFGARIFHTSKDKFELKLETARIRYKIHMLVGRLVEEIDRAKTANMLAVDLKLQK